MSQSRQSLDSVYNLFPFKYQAIIATKHMLQQSGEMVWLTVCVPVIVQ